MRYLVFLLLFSLKVVGQYNTAYYSAVEDAQLTDYRTRLASAGYTMTARERLEDNYLFTELRKAGVLAHIKELYLMRGGGDPYSLVKAKYVSVPTFPISWNVGYFSNNAVFGLQGGAFITLLPQALSPAYTTLELLAGTGFGSNEQIGIMPLWEVGGFGGTLQAAWGGNTQVKINGRSTLEFGLYHVYRSSATSLTLAINGVTVNTNTTSTAWNPDGAYLRFYSYYQSLNAVGGFCDGLMTTQQASDFAKIMANYYYLRGVHNIRPNTGALNHTITTGQSNSNGGGSEAGITTTQPFNNKMFNGRSSQGGTVYPYETFSFVPLFENTPGPNVTKETHVSSMMNTVSNLTRNDTPNDASNDGLAINVGIGSQTYNTLRKGGSTGSFEAAIGNVSVVHDNLHRWNYKGAHVVRYVNCILGESDFQNASYNLNIRQFQSDYETDCKAITGQAGIIPMIHTQRTSWAASSQGGIPTASSPRLTLAESELNFTKTILSHPAYFLPYSDGVHHTAIGYQRQGEYIGKAAYYTVYKNLVQGVYTGLKADGTALTASDVWQPLKPISGTRSGAVITLTFNSPFGASGGLAFDVSTVSDPGDKGFEVFDGVSLATISSVVISGSNQVVITLASAPSGTVEVAYAFTCKGTVPQSSSLTSGARGNLKRPSSIPSLYGNNMDDWCVVFKKTLPF